MKTGLLIAAVVGIWLNVLLPLVPRTPLAAAPTGYECREFTYTTAFKTDPADGKRYIASLTQTKYLGNLKSVSDAPESVLEAGEVLRSLGRDGWHLVWSDGTRYLVERPLGHWRRDYFSVGWEPYTPSAP